MEEPRSASNQIISGIYPRYDAALTGFRNYWYPVAFSAKVGTRPFGMTLLGEQIVLMREGPRGRVRVLHDRCPHRGIPLSSGEQLAPGTITCPYHGWTFDLASGTLVAALSDSPDSPICGKANVRTYPCEERFGLIWVYVGDGPPPPVEHDIPLDMQHPDTVLLGVARVNRGNWRYAMENAMDEGHARFLHRDALWTFFRDMPAWTRFDIGLSDEGHGAPWVVRWSTKVAWKDTYPVVGTWPRRAAWQKARRNVRVSGRLPCTLRIEGEAPPVTVFHFAVPADAGHYLRISTLMVRAKGLEALRFKAWYWLYARWVRLGQFIGQDQWMIELMRIPPERLYGPDKSITFWRKYCNEYARGVVDGATPDAATQVVAPVSADPEGVRSSGA